MKIKLIIASLILTIMIIFTYTFAFPTFSVNKIDLLKDSKENSIKSKLDPDYIIEEPEIELANANESIVLNKAFEALSAIIGKPNTEQKNDYFTQKAKYDKFLEYCADDSEIPDDKDYDIYHFTKSKEEKYNYMVSGIFNYKINTYEKLKVSKVRCYMAICYIDFRIINANFEAEDKLTKAVKTAVGDIDVEVTLINNTDARVLYLSSYSYDAIGGAELIENSENNNQYNIIDDYTYTDQDKTSIEKIYNANQKSIVNLSTIGDQNGVTSSCTGFFIAEGIIVTNYTWFQEYLISNDYLIVKDLDNKIYNVDGIVSLSSYFDVIILKLDQKAGVPIKNYSFDSNYSKNLKIALTNPNGLSVKIKVGQFLNSSDEIVKTNMPILQSEVGAPVFSLSNELIGIVNSKQYNSTVSNYSSIYLYNIAHKLQRSDFSNIKVYQLSLLKPELYSNTVSKIETPVFDYDSKIYEYYMQDIDVKEIYLNNVTRITSYDKYLEVLVKYNSNQLLSIKDYMNLYVNQLLSKDYQLITNDIYKIVVSNDTNTITLKNEENYFSINYRGKI